MVLDLKRIFASDGSVLPINYELSLSDLEIAGDHPLEKPVKINGEIKNKSSVVSLVLEIVFEFSAPCDRCGVHTVHEHTLHIDKLLAASLERQESDTIIEVPGMKFDVDEFVYTEVVVALPTKHLCKQDCKGLCATCGKNLNMGECDCRTDDIDSRFAVLKDLLNN